MIINVTESHIYYGVRQHCYSCPVANALVSAFPGQAVVVGPRTCYVGDRTYSLPGTVTQAIRDFDDGKGMLPMSFTLGEEL